MIEQLGIPREAVDLAPNLRAFAASIAESVSRGTAPSSDEAALFATVLVRTQGDRAAITDALTCLAAQTDADFEVIVTVHAAAEEADERVAAVELTIETFADRFAQRVRVLPVVGGGRSAPLNAGIAEASGAYLAFLDDDDVVTAHWIEEFRHAAQACPGAVLRTLCVLQDHVHRSDQDFAFEPVGGLVSMFNADFDYLEHRYSNQTPICAWALPIRAARTFGLWFDDALGVLEDWELLVRAASLLGVSNRRTYTSVYRRFVDGAGTLVTFDESFFAEVTQLVRGRLDGLPALLTPGAIAHYTEVHEARSVLQFELAKVQFELTEVRRELSDAHARLDEDRAERHRLAGVLANRDLELTDIQAQLDAVQQSRYWRMSRPLRRLTSMRGSARSSSDSD